MILPLIGAVGIAAIMAFLAAKRETGHGLPAREPQGP
jgi:hypothetical protein